MNVKRLLSPKSIAVVGANERMGSFGNYSALNANQNGENVQVYFVNAKGGTVLGKTAYKTLSELPEVPDSIMLATPKSTIPALLEEAGRLGVGGAVIVAAGYSEEGTEQGKADEQVIIDIARKYDIAVMGPNCTGFVNNIDKIKLWGMAGTDFDMTRRKTGVAFFAQSGTMAIHALSCTYVDISYVFSMGNSVILSLEDVMEYVVEDPKVTMLCIYLEGVRDGRRFMDTLKRARELGKPVVIHASGMSKKGAVAAASHTGNLASSRNVYRAVCEKYGVVLVESIDEFLCAANVLSSWQQNKMPAGGRIAAVNGSGGENAVCADLSELYDVPLPDLAPETIEKLKKTLPVFAAPRNPLDITAIVSDTDSVCIATLKALGEDPNVDAVAFTIAQFNEMNEKDRQQALVFGESLNERYGRPCIEYSKMEGSVPVMVIPQVEDRRDFEWRMKLKESGIPILATSHIGYKVLGCISKYLEYPKEAHMLKNAAPDRPLTGERISYTEAESKEMLGKAGIRFPKQKLVDCAEQLEEALTDMSEPFVLKVSSRDIPHKTEAGGVKLNVSKENALAAFTEIIESCKNYDAEARIDGILVQEMALPGTEMIVGVSSNPQFGPMLVVGSGGVYVDVFQDMSMAPCPVCREEAIRMIDSLRSVKLLNGYRGSKPCDKEALAEIMVSVSEFAYEKRNTLKELDLNPVIVYEQGKGAIAVDALIVEQK